MWWIVLNGIFGVDARSKIVYQQFENAITFDTTYKTNRYNILFALFIGLNNQYKSLCLVVPYSKTTKRVHLNSCFILD